MRAGSSCPSPPRAGAPQRTLPRSRGQRRHAGKSKSGCGGPRDLATAGFHAVADARGVAGEPGRGAQHGGEQARKGGVVERAGLEERDLGPGAAARGDLVERAHERASGVDAGGGAGGDPRRHLPDGHDEGLLADVRDADDAALGADVALDDNAARRGASLDAQADALRQQRCAHLQLLEQTTRQLGGARVPCDGRVDDIISAAHARQRGAATEVHKPTPAHDEIGQLAGHQDLAHVHARPVRRPLEPMATPLRAVDDEGARLGVGGERNTLRRDPGRS